ncbi:MAG: hypothetical protein ABI459_05800, partial [Deltaproteobacteria bacterium]
GLAIIKAFERHRADYNDLNSILFDFTMMGNVARELATLTEDRDFRERIVPTQTMLPPWKIKMEPFIKSGILYSAIIFQSYALLVAGRADEILGSLSKIHKIEKNPEIKVAIGLLRCAEVRHIRNSLAHGTYHRVGDKVTFSDRRKSELVSLELLRKLNQSASLVLMTKAVASSGTPESPIA